jgi:CHAT domain-containing protein/Tfp pilus assembly protein PilF
MAWKFLVLTAQGLDRQHRAEESERLLSDIPEDLPRALRAHAYITRAYGLCDLDRRTEAAALLEQSEPLAAGSPPLQAQVQFTRGICIAPEDRNRAEGYFQQAATLAHGVDRYLEARAFIERGHRLMQDGRYDQAVDDLNRGLAATDSRYLQQVALGNLGYSHERLGDWKGAPAYLERAEELASSMNDAKASRALWLVDLGGDYFSQLQYVEAGKAWSKALSMARELDDVSLKQFCFNNLAILSLTTGDLAGAERYVEEGKQLKAPEEQQLYLVLTEARLAKLNHNLHLAEYLMLGILAAHPDVLTRYNTQTELATLYSEQGRAAEAERMFRKGIATAEQAFSLVESDKFRISFMDQEPFYDRYVSFLVSQNRPADALIIAERGRSRALAGALGLNPDTDLNLASLQRALHMRNQMVLAYWLSPKQSYLWVITPSQMRLLKLAPEMDIVQFIDSYSQEVLDISGPEDSKLAQKLYEMLVAPAEKYIPRGARVIIVPHRRLYKLNFETLVSPHPKPHFWIEDVCVQYSSFLAALEKTNTAQPHYRKDLLLMGAPVEASKDFPGLAHAPEEIEKVAAHFPQGQETVIDGAAATPGAYQRSDPSDYRFFHFVTHGTASDVNPLDSAIILSPGQKGYKLYARDIIKTNIHPELVTISTCYGAGTRQYSGEGLVGLAWAFLRVGARQVVAALWEVDDAASADLMDHFYAELTRGKTPAEALRDGKLAMLHSQGPRRHPYYWASLQLYTGR